MLLFAFGASFTQRVTGFGFGIFIMSVLPHIMPSYGEATALSGMLALTNVCVTAIKKRRYIVWSKVLPILFVFLLVSFFSVRAVSQIDGHLLRKILGAVLILISIYFFVFSGRIRVRPSVPSQLGLGTVSGLMGGFFAMQGPPAVIYFLSSTESKEEYIGQISFYFVVGNLMMTFFRYSSGLVTLTVCKAWIIAVPAVILGYFVGKLVYDKMPIDTLRKVVYGFMAVSGGVALLS